MLVQDAVEADVPALQHIAEECAYISKWTGKPVGENDLLNEFLQKILPPKGIKNRHRLQTIIHKKSADVMGYIVMYHGYPQKNVFWIGALMISPAYQGKKFGQQIYMQLEKEVKSIGLFSSIALGVGIENVPALRFWIGNGFARILECRKPVDGFTDLVLAKDMRVNGGR